VQRSTSSDRHRFFSLASEMMRRILVDHARKRLAQKRGRDRTRIWDTDLAEHIPLAPADIMAVHEALDRLAMESPTIAEVVRLRIFAGLSLDDAAEALEVGRSTIHRRWNYGKARLMALMKGFSETP
jgi:RNA polymerase sigma factor (TIGR02999 family)